MYNQYIILADAKPGREAEYDDWYVWVHTHDVMASRPAAIAAQCFRRIDADKSPGQRFLCLFENSDPAEMTGKSLDYSHMLISSAADSTRPPGGGYYDTVIQQIKSPAFADSGLVMEYLDGPAATPEAIAWTTTTRFPALLRHPGIIAGWLGQASGHQIYQAPRPAYMAIYRVTDPAQAAAIWRDMESVAPLPWEAGNVTPACFSPLAKRLTRLQLLEPDDVWRAQAQAMREQVVRREQAGPGT